MTYRLPPPAYSEVIEPDGKMKRPWLEFCNGLWVGDTGTPSEGSGSWTPTFTGLTEVGGAATITGRVFKISQQIAYFWARVVPVTNTSSVLGTTYINNLPLDVISHGACVAVVEDITSGAANGIVEPSFNRIYTPTWTNITSPITIVGTIEAR